MGCRNCISLIHQVANHPTDSDVGPFVIAANVISFADLAATNYSVNTRAMILNIEPVTDIAAITIDRYPALILASCNHSRDKFFGVLIGAIVV